MSTSLERALDILQSLSVRPDGPRQLSEMLDVHRSTVVRLLHSMESRGFVRRLPDGRWGIGFDLVEIGQRALDGIDLRDAARPHIQSLADELGHTVHVAELVGSDIVYVDKIEGLGSVKMRSRVGAKANAHAAGVAKAALAYAPAAVQDTAIVACDFERFTASTITDADGLRADFARIRARGWAIDDAEGEDYINCIAFPLFGLRDEVRGAVSVTAVRSIAPVSVLERHASRIRRAADAISAELGRPTPAAAAGAVTDAQLREPLIDS
ncbi:IclR family transcriptional regulator [Microbacterium awajiense]|uniref:IclR family transcriptional regulator n=1 Tax=Microbacterium awajiense TaxID=415214 RepID=A0ABP7AT03_9MICO